MENQYYKKQHRGITNKNFITEQSAQSYDNYENFRQITTSQFGEVYICTHIPSKRTRCMKIYKKEKLNNINQNNFEEEIELVKQLDHPNIFKIYEFFQDGSNFYLVSEYLDGGELFDYIEKNKTFDEKTVCIIMEQVFSAILYLHKRGIVHRDIKPENIMLSKKDDIYSIKLIDFGTSKAFIKDDKMNAPMGTCYYMAPEMLRRNYDERIDIWACGIMMYMMLVGYPPFNGDDNLEIFTHILKSPLLFDKDDWEDKTPSARDLLSRILEKDPEKRISIDDIFNHEWFKRKFDTVCFDYQSVANRFKAYHRSSKLEKAIRMFIVQTYDLEEDERVLLALFKEHDLNHDGMLDVHELTEALKKMDNPLEAHEFLALADVNQNGVVNFSEFLMVAIDFKKKINDNVLESIFRTIDVGNDGYITKIELRKFLNLEEHDPLLDELIKEVDKNNDSFISLDEFLLSLKNISSHSSMKKV